VTLGRVGIIVAARTASVRLPGKALLPLHGMPMVIFLLRRLRDAKLAEVILATTEQSVDDRLAEAVAVAGVPVFRGADADVVSRYVSAAATFGFDTVARVTADCPFVNAELADWCIARAAEIDRFDLVTTKGAFPVGLDVEIYRTDGMAALDRGKALSKTDREHLTLHFYDHREAFAVKTIAPPTTWPRTSRRFTVDAGSDYEAAKNLVVQMGCIDFSIPAMLRTAQ
jgi:spore coat polysaccharide biosynthesis protein SpsF